VQTSTLGHPNGPVQTPCQSFFSIDHVFDRRVKQLTELLIDLTVAFEALDSINQFFKLLISARNALYAIREY
jgi:hypothetical protein